MLASPLSDLFEWLIDSLVAWVAARRRPPDPTVISLFLQLRSLSPMQFNLVAALPAVPSVGLGHNVDHVEAVLTVNGKADPAVKIPADATSFIFPDPLNEADAGSVLFTYVSAAGQRSIHPLTVPFNVQELLPPPDPTGITLSVVPIAAPAAS